VLQRAPGDRFQVLRIHYHRWFVGRDSTCVEGVADRLEVRSRQFAVPANCPLLRWGQVSRRGQVLNLEFKNQDLTPLRLTPLRCVTTLRCDPFALS
jgi:hypothetical protein